MQRTGLLALIASALLIVAGCGGDDVDIVQGDTNVIVEGGTGGDTGGDGGDGGDGGNGGDPTPATGDFFDLGGFLLNEDIHPLLDNIDPTGGGSPDITPETPLADQTTCPAGTIDPDSATINSVVLFDDGDFFEGGDANPEFPVCVIDSDFREDGGPTTYTLTNDHVYLLLNAALVGNGGALDQTEADAEDVTLNIEAGTQIYAQAGERASIRVTRGSTININGTSDQPVIMAAVDATNTNITGDPTDLTGRGDWGGLVVDGFAPTNGTDAGNGGDGSNDVPNEQLSEAAPTGQTNVYFGGGNPNDSSGSITYILIGESGVSFRPDAELQGLTLEGVGDGTTIENVQIFGSDDDGIEWFGGTVDVSNVIINAASDDGLDIDLGYQGVIKNAIVRQGSQVGDRTSEADGNGDGFDRTPVTRPVLANVLMLGDGDNESIGLMMREGYGADFEHVVVADGGVVTTVADTVAYGLGCFLNRDEVDEDLNALGLAFFCTNDAAGGDPGEADASDNLFPVWAAGGYDENGDGSADGAVTFDATEDSGLSVDGSTYEVTTSAALNGSVTEADAYYGAVDPADAAAGTEFWRGWTVHISNR
ncbi:hypothetical protein PC39_00460 [Salinisphaera sp. PC39]